MATRPIKSKRPRRSPIGLIAGRIFRDLIDGQELTSSQLAQAFRIPVRTVQRMAQLAREEDGTTAAAAADFTAGERRHLARTYGRSSDPTVQAFLQQQNRRAGR